MGRFYGGVVGWRTVPAIEDFIVWLIAASPTMRKTIVTLIREQVCIWCGNLLTGADTRCTECPRGRKEALRSE